MLLGLPPFSLSINFQLHTHIHTHKMTTITCFHICQLPEELLLRVFSYLEYFTLLVLAQVSKEISRISNDMELWKHLFENNLDLLPFVQNTTLALNKPSTNRRINTTMTWKQFYNESYFKQRPKYLNNQQDFKISECSLPSSLLRMQRTRILYIGPKKSGKSTLFYHLKFGTSFKGIYPALFLFLFLLSLSSSLSFFVF